MGESADIEEIEFLTDSDEETASIVPYDAPLRFVSQCHLTGTKTFMLIIIDGNFIEFLTFLLLIRNYTGLRCYIATSLSELFPSL